MNEFTRETSLCMLMRLGEKKQVIAMCMFVCHPLLQVMPTWRQQSGNPVITYHPQGRACVQTQLRALPGSLLESWACLTWTSDMTVLCQGLQSFRLYHPRLPATALMLSLQVTCHSCCGFTFAFPEVAALPSSFDRCAISMDAAVIPDGSSVTHETNPCSWFL